MQGAHFKKLHSISGARTEPETSVVDKGELSGSVVKPHISLFQNLPVIESDSPRLKLAVNELNSDQVDVDSSKTPYKNGVTEGEKKAGLVYLDTIKLMENTLESLKRQYGLVRAEIENSHLKAVLSCLESVLPELVSKSAHLQIQATIKELCKPALTGKISLRINPEQNAEIEQFISAEAGGQDIFNLIFDANIAPNDLVAQWDGGGVAIDTNSLLQQCLSALDTAVDFSKNREGLANE